MSKVAGFYRRNKIPYSYYGGKKHLLYKKIEKRLREQERKQVVKPLHRKLKVLPSAHPLRYEGTKDRGKDYRLYKEGRIAEIIIQIKINPSNGNPMGIKEIRFRPKGSDQEISLDDLVAKEENMRRY